MCVKWCDLSSWYCGQPGFSCWIYFSFCDCGHHGSFFQGLPTDFFPMEGLMSAQTFLWELQAVWMHGGCYLCSHWSNSHSNKQRESLLLIGKDICYKPAQRYGAQGLYVWHPAGSKSEQLPLFDWFSLTLFHFLILYSSLKQNWMCFFAIVLFYSAHLYIKHSEAERAVCLTEKTPRVREWDMLMTCWSLAHRKRTKICSFNLSDSLYQGRDGFM